MLCLDSAASTQILSWQQLIADPKAGGESLNISTAFSLDSARASWWSVTYVRRWWAERANFCWPKLAASQLTCSCSKLTGVAVRAGISLSFCVTIYFSANFCLDSWISPLQLLPSTPSTSRQDETNKKKKMDFFFLGSHLLYARHWSMFREWRQFLPPRWQTLWPGSGFGALLQTILVHWMVHQGRSSR